MYVCLCVCSVCLYSSYQPINTPNPPNPNIPNSWALNLACCPTSRLRAMSIGFRVWAILLILKVLHDLSILQYHYSQGLGYLERCRIFSLHRRGVKFRVKKVLDPRVFRCSSKAPRPSLHTMCRGSPKPVPQLVTCPKIPGTQVSGTWDHLVARRLQEGHQQSEKFY